MGGKAGHKATANLIIETNKVDGRPKFQEYQGIDAVVVCSIQEERRYY
jgi:hypothetical protein